MKKIEHFIGGNFTSITSKKTSLVYNPATGENIAEVSLGNESCINQAIAKFNIIYTKSKSKKTFCN